MNNKREIIEELHKQMRKNFKRRRVIMKDIDDLWQADLVEMLNYQAENKGYRYLLTVIDTFSKKAWAVAVKNKTAQSITDAMESIFNNSNRIPNNLQTDDGKEFFNKIFQKLMSKHQINHYSTYSSLKASIIERFNRTLKNMMWKEFSFNGTYQWINQYKKLVDKYNNSFHRTIKMSPNEVNNTNKRLLLNTVYNNLKVFHKPKFKINDNVRISKYKHLFEKGYTPNWTTEVFKIKNIQNTNPTTYLLQDYEGNDIKGGFYEQELMKTKFPHTYLVEKILKKTKNRAYVKWLGFPSKHNSWIDLNSNR